MYWHRFTLDIHTLKIGGGRRERGFQWKPARVSFARFLPLLKSPAFCTERSCLWCQSNTFLLAPASTAVCNTLCSWQRNGCTTYRVCLWNSPCSEGHYCMSIPEEKNRWCVEFMGHIIACWISSQIAFKLISTFSISFKNTLQEIPACETQSEPKAERLYWACILCTFAF